MFGWGMRLGVETGDVSHQQRGIGEPAFGMDDGLRGRVEHLHLEATIGRRDQAGMHQFDRDAERQWKSHRLMFAEHGVGAGSGVAYLKEVAWLQILDEHSRGDDTAIDALGHVGFVCDQSDCRRLQARRTFTVARDPETMYGQLLETWDVANL